MIKVEKIYMDGGILKPWSRVRIPVTDKKAPEFSWSVISDNDGNIQSAYRLTISDGENTVCDTGWRESKDQRAECPAGLPLGRKLSVSVSVKDKFGEVSEPFSREFISGLLDEWYGEWITSLSAEHERPTLFQKDFRLGEGIKRAVLYVSGVGYHYVKINGKRPDDSYLDPATSNFAKTCYYTVLPVESLLAPGENSISVEVGDGWRWNQTDMFRVVFGQRKVEFYGDTALNAFLSVEYENGKKDIIATDTSWKCAQSDITEVSIFKGERVDARIEYKWEDAIIAQAPGGKLTPMALEPILPHEEYAPVDVFEKSKGVYIVDFGQNIAGIARIMLPAGMKSGDTVTLRFGEMLDFDGGLYNEPLRYATQTDSYTFAGDGKDAEIFEPKFTYHGFRYCEVTGYPGFTPDKITAVALYTDIAKDSNFTCGSALVSKIHKNCVQTEKSNIHSILTDCPQRDERMAWMNDATVRFEETPYNFDIGRIFAKVSRDIKNEQREDGAFTCCAPFLYGSYPADPVCSSYLVAGISSLMHAGNIWLIAEYFDGYAAWENSLLSRSTNYIVDYTYYGDWAGPAYACMSPENAFSAVTPGQFMSTGYSYFNCKTLARFADILGRTDMKEKYSALAEKIKAAMLEKWFDPERAVMATGSQACQVFALWLGIIPEDKRAAAAAVVHHDLVDRNYKITTGNLCTRYLMDMLAEYGYINDAWKIITSEEYPSYGYMIQNEATTVWERFELKLEPGMNSHNHPMYAAVDYWLYAYILGVKPTVPGFEEFTVRPFYPDGLMSAQGHIDTVMGKIYVRWVKKFGKCCLYVNVPFGTSAKVIVENGKEVTVGSGSHAFTWDI